MDQESDSPNPLLNPLILSKVMEHLDNPSLMEARQVCHLWNGEAGPILMKRSRIRFSSACEMYDDESWMDCKNRILAYGKLKDLLDLSPNPGVIFHTLQLDFAVLKNVFSFLPLLENFGYLLKSLEFWNCTVWTHHEDSFDDDDTYSDDEGQDGEMEMDADAYLRRDGELQSYLHPLLTKYCLNLIHLNVRVESKFGGRDDEDETQQTIPILKIVQPLMLESIEISGVQRGPPAEYEFNFLLEVIKASPKLKKLNVTVGSKFVQSVRFCENISALGVFMKLEEFNWGFVHDSDRVDDEIDEDKPQSWVKQKNVTDMLQQFSKVDMQKLWNLSLRDLPLYDPKMVSELLKLFNRNGRNQLRTLTLTDVVIKIDKLVFPLFSTLKFQEILSFCPGINSIHVISSTSRPDLKDSMIDLVSLKLKPCQSLIKLSISSSVLKNVDSFKAILEWFPNLVYLKLDNIKFKYTYTPTKSDLLDDNPRKTPEKTVLKEDIEHVMKSLDCMQKLRELILSVDFCFKQKEDLLAKVIEMAHNAPVLKLLTIIDGHCYGEYTMEDLKPALMQTIGFDCVRFENFSVKDGPNGELEIFTFISENNLPVNFIRW